MGIYKIPIQKSLIIKLVPSKGLEPPHPCEYMDLNHARLPIPPRWQVDLHHSGGPKAAVSGRPTVLFYRHDAPCQTTHETSCHGAFPRPPRKFSALSAVKSFCPDRVIRKPEASAIPPPTPVSPSS